MKKARILALVLTLILIASIFAVYSFAAGDVTTRKSENYEGVAVGTTGTASDGKNPTVGNTIFQIGGRLGKYEIIEENGNQYALITPVDKPGTSEAYTYMKLGSNGTLVKDSAGNVTGVKKGTHDLSNYKYQVFEVDIMAPGGRFIDGATIDIQGRDQNKSGNVGYWNPNATTNLITMYNSSGTTYLSANSGSDKLYINPYEFTKVQIIVENLTKDGDSNYSIQSHVYVNGEFWFTKKATDVPTSYAGGTPNAVFTEIRINYKKTADEKASLAIDNLAWKTVPMGTSTTVAELVAPYEGEANVEYVSGGKTIRANTSLTNAVKLADAGTTVKLLADCKHSISYKINDVAGHGITVDKNLTIDLNGHTFEAVNTKTRRDGGVFTVSAGKTLTITSSEVGAKIFVSSTGNTADPLVATAGEGAILKINAINDEGIDTLAFYGSSLIRAWSHDCTVNINGGEYYRLKNSDYGLIQLQKNFTLTVKDALLYDAVLESTDGIFSLNGRKCVGGTQISNATVDNCVLIAKTNIVPHTYKNANVTFTGCLMAGDINPVAFSNSSDGTQTPGVVVLGDGCAVNGNLASNVLCADEYVLQKVSTKQDLTLRYNSFATNDDGSYTVDALTVKEYDLELVFDRIVSNEGLDIPVVWKDKDGKVIANTTAIRGATITVVPYEQFAENGAIYVYTEGWINGVPNEWNESLTIPVDFEGDEYVLTYKDGGKLYPYEATFGLYFNVAAESHLKVNFFLPELPEGIELSKAYVGSDLIYGDGVDNAYNVLLGGENYLAISDFVGVVSGATSYLTATITVICDGVEVERELSIDMATYCNTVIDGSAYKQSGKALAVNIANYLVACADFAGAAKTEVTSALEEVVSENSALVKAPAESELVKPDSSIISDYVSGAQIIINKDGPEFIFTLTEKGKAANVELSTNIGNAENEHYSEVGYIKSGKDTLANVNRITVSVTPDNGKTVSFTYTLANYCKALEDTAAANVASALYGFVYTQMAYAGVRDVSIRKYASHNETLTVSCGDKITYYIEVTNNEAADITVTLTDSIPENTTYVSGADSESSGRVYWNLSIPKGETANVSYTVKVNDDKALYEGGVIKSTYAAVGATKASANGIIYIERTFNEADRKYIDIAIDALADSTFEDMILAKWIYYVAYSQDEKITATASATLISSILDGSITAAQLDMIVPTLYGGTEIDGAIAGVKGAPAAAVYAANLITGDLVFTSEAGVVSAYIYGSDGLYSIARGCVKVDTNAILDSLTEKDIYVVMRPSFGFVNFTPTDMDKAPDVLNEKQQALVDTAKYYVLRGEWLQYSDSYYAVSVSGYTNESRWEYGQKTPEESTSQKFGYINCAAFTHDVYWTTFGKKLPGSMYTTANLTTNSDGNNMRMFYFSRAQTDVHTEEEKAEVQKQFLETLQPGDIMVTRRGSSGHAMLYIGDGLFIHSSGSSYDYNNSVEYYDPTIRYHRVMDYFFNESSTGGYVFGNVTDLSIVRPLNNPTWANYEVTEATKNRNANLMGIIVQKLPSVAPNETVNPGDTITYTFSINNTRDTAATFDLSDKVPTGTVYVSGDCTKSGDNLSWTVTVPADSTVTVSYTVQVSAGTAYGSHIVANDSVIAGVPLKTYEIGVRRTLTAAEQELLINTFAELKADGTLKNLELVNELYKRVLGIENIFDTDFLTVMEGDEGVFTAEGMPVLSQDRQSYKPNLDGDYFNLVAEGLFGGRRLNTANIMNVRTELGREEHLVVGDIVFGKTLSSNVLYIYVGGDYMISLSTLKADTNDINLRLERLPAYGYYYAILRPSFAAE